VNQPASVNGYRIYLTAWGDDDEGRAFAGFQATRDPGEWLLWIASLALTLGVIVMLFAEGAWVAERDGRLEGRCSRDRRRFAEFLREIAKGENETPPAPGLGGREEGREP
jgi:cytochrome c biogenesis protein ResB